MTKRIIIGNVREELYDSPIRMFKMAVRLSKKDNWTVSSNNPQFIEALELLCGEEKVEVYFKKFNSNKMQLITFKNAYDYLGDVYDIINSIRSDVFFDRLNDDDIVEEIRKYEEKWNELSNER